MSKRLEFCGKIWYFNYKQLLSIRSNFIVKGG